MERFNDGKRLGLDPIRYNRIPGLEFDMMNGIPGDLGVGHS